MPNDRNEIDKFEIRFDDSTIKNIVFSNVSYCVRSDRETKKELIARLKMDGLWDKLETVTLNGKQLKP